MKAKESLSRFDTGATKPIRVTIPAEVVFDLERFQKVQKDILGRLGCMACTSGFDIRYEFERRFIVDANLDVRAGTQISASEKDIRRG